MMMSGRRLALMILAISLASHPAASSAQETCYKYGTEFGDFRECVSSVLPPQGAKNYGPEHLTGSSGGAWCEGVPGHGVGQAITFHQTPAHVIATIMFVNGYAASEKTFRENGRVKRVRIETSGGYTREINLKDTRDVQKIKLSPSRVAWIRSTILDVYPGDKHQDTCISTLSAVVDEFLNK
jgi:hypothetical protein